MIHESWGEELIELAKINKKYLISLGEKFLPAEKDIFKTLEKPFQDVKVLIIGQDPYPGKGKDGVNHAHGLAFSSLSKDTPASLRNIFKELRNEHQDIKLESNNLTPWADQGVMLLNRALILTLDENQNSQKLLKKNLEIWKDVINQIIEKLLNKDKPLVVMLWGKEANGLIEKEPKDKENILFLRASHPASRNGSFKNCGHFSQCNDFLSSLGVKEIDWST